MLASSATPHLNYHDLDNVLTPPETEHNWAAKEAAIKTLGAACQSSIAQNHDYIHFIKNHRKSFTESVCLWSISLYLRLSAASSTCSPMFVYRVPAARCSMTNRLLPPLHHQHMTAADREDPIVRSGM